MSLIANDAKPVYRVADLAVDPSQARVSRDGVEIELPKLSFDLLVALIERAPAIVSPDELMAAVWPGLVVSPETISQRIKLLRGALGDDFREPRYVAGVRGRGYRLVPDVQTGSTPRNAGSPVAGPPPTPLSRTKWAVAALAVLALAMVLVLRRDPAAPNLPAPRRSVAVLPFESVDDAPRSKELALGVSEALLHQLAAVQELSVTARTSSAAAAASKDDARTIGRRLRVHYLLEGSVQHEGERLRVTAQLIDTDTGEHVWSMRFDRRPQDVFQMQDEIALAVTRALKLSLDASAADRLLVRRTANLDAYFAYLQGRALAVTMRIGDLKAAAGQFEQATKLDPGFAAAYVELAAARMQVAEFDITADRQENFDDARVDSAKLLERALALDPGNAEAFAQRAYLRAFGDLAAAELDYRKSISLAPSYAPAYEGLAGVLYETPARRNEALAMIERARALDPLEPRYDVTKSVFLLYGMGQIEAGSNLLHDVIERDPLYQPALMRYGETRGCLQGEQAQAIDTLEAAVELDPSSDNALSALEHNYLDVGDLAAALNVITEYEHTRPGQAAVTAMYRHDWLAAGESAYDSIASATLAAYDEPQVELAIRMHARTSGDYRRAQTALARMSGASWDATGTAHVSPQVGLAAASVALGDVLIASGEVARGRAVLRASLDDMSKVMRENGRTDFWYVKDRAIALALLGEDDAAMKQIEYAVAAHYGVCHWWAFLDVEPAFEKLRKLPRYTALLGQVRTHVTEQRAAVDRLRSEGVIPERR